MRKSVRLLKFLWKSVPFCLIAAIVSALIFYPKEKTSEEEPIAVVRVWNVDTFEGGKGSRTNFLRRIASGLEGGHEVYYLIESYTAEGARAALAEGKKPDLISFGVGLPDFMPYALALPYSFSGGKNGNQCLAVPWCAGRYSLFSLQDDFGSEGAVAVSDGGANLCEMVAYYAAIEGETVESSEAYVGFLNGKYRYLLGTQRDECRFRSRGVEVFRRELPEYCDLFQYISILSAEKSEYCTLFLEALLDENAQNSLDSIGMFPVGQTTAKRTVGVFTDGQSLAALKESARRKDDIKNIDKLLKTI